MVARAADRLFPRKPPTKETKDPERHLGTLITRQKMDELQRKKRVFLLLRDGKPTEGDGEATPPGLQPLQPHGFWGLRQVHNVCLNMASPGHELVWKLCW